MESNDFPEIQDRGETSDIPSLPSGVTIMEKCQSSLKKNGIDKSTEWSTIPACPSLMCSFNRGDTEGTNSSKILCPMFVCVLFCVNLCHD